MKSKSEDGTRKFSFDSLATTVGSTLTTGDVTTEDGIRTLTSVIPTATATVDIGTTISTITACPLPGATTISIPTKGVGTVKIDIEDFIKGLQRHPENEERITLRKFLERYRIEPRGDTASKWMVIYDKKNNTYIKDTDSKSKRAYLKFNDTDDMLDFFKKYNKEV